MNPSNLINDGANHNKPTIHIIGLPHTIVSNGYSTCAFTGKVLRFSKMMRKYGWVIHEYSNEGSQSDANVHHHILTRNELDELRKVKDGQELYDADINNISLYQTFWSRVFDVIKKSVTPGDIVCHVFGPNHELCHHVPDCYHVESGIGYTHETSKLNYRIFETNAWMHWHYGRHHESIGNNYHWVIPNYYDTDEWDVNLRPEGNYILFFGRIVPLKGIDTIVEIAKRMPDERFIICGQGDATPWTSQTPNIESIPPIYGADRSRLIGNAKCMLMPTVFIEPFGGSGAEAQLCGTPLIAINYGAFKENIEDRKTGFLCNTLADWVESIRRIDTIDRGYVGERARNLWSLEAVGRQYDIVFRQLADQRYDGWYSEKSHRFIHPDPSVDDIDTD